MPTYDYRCLACNHQFEAFQRMSDAPLTECPRCKGEVKRLVGGGAGFLFKGSGFYTTDYRSNDYRSRAKSDTKDSSSSSSASSDSKPAKKEKAAES